MKFDEPRDVIYVHYGKRVDLHYVTDYQTWKDGVSYPVNTTVYNPDEDKHYKSIKSTSSSWDISEWAEFTSENDKIHEDIFSSHSADIDNEFLIFVSYYEHHSKKLMFRSNKYLYAFDVSGTFSGDTMTLTRRYHNNPNVNLSDYKGMILGPTNTNVSNIDKYKSKNLDFIREEREDLMEQNIICSKGGVHKNVFTTLYRRYRLPVYNDSTSYPEHTIVIDPHDNSHKRITSNNVSPNAIVDANYILQNYSEGSRVIFENDAGVKHMYKAINDINVEPDVSNLWVSINYETWTDGSSYSLNTIVHKSDENKYYKALVNTTSSGWVANEWAEHVFEEWDGINYNVDDVVSFNGEHYKAQQVINESMFNPDVHSSWLKVEVSDNNGYNKTEVFATVLQTWPGNHIWAEYVLISTDSPHYTTLHPYYDSNSNSLQNDSEQDQRHILNTREGDLPAFKDFCDKLDENSKVQFYGYGQSILIGTINKNNNFHVLHFTSLYEEYTKGEILGLL